MGTSALIPAAPVLLDDVDRSEPPQIARLREAIRQVLRTEESWALPVETLPPVAGLGGWGIDRGIETETGRLLTGPEWIEAVESLTPADRQLAEAADPAIIVALLHAHAAEVAVGPIGSSENLLLPLDLSGAATDDAPLAPIDGAAEFDADLVDALTAESSAALNSGTTDRSLAGGSLTTSSDVVVAVDSDRLFDLCFQARDVHADLTVVEAGIRNLISANATLSPFDLVFDEPVHDVRSICGTGTWTRADDD
ncbi:hypothetical protein [Brevibacterium atlanticum]|uniref:hypothetical protein n=1 Tax=Brevibacterium atlanticum TaxID=2697563 RepID=UPI0014235C4E|nr:hypothetical protein [Brevibacterium atlanticum]